MSLKWVSNFAQHSKVSIVLPIFNETFIHKVERTIAQSPESTSRKTVGIPLLRHSECLLSLFSMLGDHRKPQPIFSFEILASHKTSHICLRVTQTDFFHCFAFHLPLGCSATLQTCCTCWSELLRTASLFHFVKSCSTKGLSKSAKAACQSPGPCEIQFLLKSLVNAVLSGSVNCPQNNAFPNLVFSEVSALPLFSSSPW